MRDNLADLKVKLRPIDALLPYARNPRTHSEAQIAQIAASMVEFGWTNPVLVDGHNGVIAGHGRLLAARKLGLMQVPVVELAHLSETQKRAYVIADNQLALASSWDEEMLRVELEALKTDDFDLGLVGFDPDELAKLLDGEEPDEGLTDDDAIPEPPDKAVSRRGDLWILGDHRLLCGDSGNGEEMDRLLDGVKIHLVHTDPPYNVKVEPRSNNAIAAGLSSFPSADPLDVARRKTQAIGTTRKLRPKDRPLENDFVSEEDFAALLLAWFGNMARVLEPGRGFYIWGGYSNIENYPPVLKQCKLYFSQTVIWVKEHPVLTRKDFMGNHEWAFYGWRQGAAHYFHPEIHNATDVWSVKKVNPQSMVHLTEKPVGLAVRAMTYSSRPGENVLDLFGGSGSTLIGAEKTGRRAYLMELDPLYCDVIIQRWQSWGGQKATRHADGVSFEQASEMLEVSQAAMR